MKNPVEFFRGDPAQRSILKAASKLNASGRNSFNPTEKQTQTKAKLLGKTLNRRRFVAGLAVIGVTAPVGRYMLLSQQQEPVVTESFSFDADMKVISEDVVTSINPAEKQLWQNAFPHSDHAVAVTDASLHLVELNFYQTLANMGDSKNAYLRHASDVILQQSQNQILRVSIDGTVGTDQGEAFAAVTTEIENDNVQIVLHLDGNQILNNSNGLSLAIALAHEMQHVEDKIEFQSSLPTNLSSEERLQKAVQNHQANSVSTEMAGYATQAEAILEALRLGVSVQLPEDFVHIAAMFIRSGRNRDSQAWRNYIASRLHLS